MEIIILSPLTHVIAIVNAIGRYQSPSRIFIFIARVQSRKGYSCQRFKVSEGQTGIEASSSCQREQLREMKTYCTYAQQIGINRGGRVWFADINMVKFNALINVLHQKGGENGIARKVM